MPLQLLSHAEQVAVHLRSELLKGRWSRVLPGIMKLEREIGVNHNTIDAALRLLEQQGLLVPQGNGRPRKIVVPDDYAPPALLVAILHYEQADQNVSYHLDLRHQLLEEGHTPFSTPKSPTDLGFDVRRTARLVKQTKADAWIVAGGSYEILEWFTRQAFPTFALFGRPADLDIAYSSPRKAPALITALHRLVELGHQRIVLLTREDRVIPHPALFEQIFLNQLESLGITPGPYHLPVWKNDVASFYHCMDSLFAHTPPTTLIIDEAPLYFACQQYLARRRLVAPEDISLICCDPSPDFAWADPSIAHFHWDPRPVVRRVVRWVNNAASGRNDRRKRLFRASFVEGGTIGPVAGKR